MDALDWEYCLVVFALDSTEVIKEYLGLQEIKNYDEYKKIAKRLIIEEKIIERCGDYENRFISAINSEIGIEGVNILKEWLSKLFYLKRNFLKEFEDIISLLEDEWNCVNLKDSDAPLKSIKFLKERQMIRECKHQTLDFMDCCIMLEDMSDSDIQVRSQVELYYYNDMGYPIVLRYYKRELFRIPLYYDEFNSRFQSTKLFKHLMERLPRNEKVKMLEFYFKDKISKAKKRDNSNWIEIIDLFGVR